MASSRDTVLCGICNKQEVIKPAEKWCPECDEGLCVDCEKHHCISKASRHHVVISIDDYKGLPAEISQILHHCDVNKREFKMYCPHHDKPCCPRCISNHKTCTGLVAIEDVVKNAKTSSLMETIDQSLRDSKMNLEKIINDRERNLSNIKEQRKQIHVKIKQKRDEINNHLDNLERKFIEELDTSEKSLTLQIVQLLGHLKEKSKVINQLQRNITAIKTHASDLHIFLGSKQFEKQADQEEKYIKALVIDGTLQTTNFNCTIDERITTIAAISNFGSVTIEKAPTSVVISTEKDKQAQMMSSVQMRSRSIDDLKLTLIRTFCLPNGNSLTGCSIFHDGRIAFVDSDYNRRIVITNDHGILQNEISMSFSYPFDVTCLDNNSIAVTNLSDTSIRIINTTSQTTTNKIITTATCYGITNRQGTLIYCEHGKGIIRHQLDTKSSNTVVRQNITDLTYVTLNENNIYHTNIDTVTCFNLNGDKIWEFKDTSVLNNSRGVAVDRYSNVYVVSLRNSSIIVISSDGKKSRTILQSKDGITNPWALTFDEQKLRLLVTDFYGEVLLFDLTSV